MDCDDGTGGAPSQKRERGPGRPSNASKLGVPDWQEAALGRATKAARPTPAEAEFRSRQVRRARPNNNFTIEPLTFVVASCARRLRSCARTQGPSASASTPTPLNALFSPRTGSWRTRLFFCSKRFVLSCHVAVVSSSSRRRLVVVSSSSRRRS